MENELVFEIFHRQQRDFIINALKESTQALLDFNLDLQPTFNKLLDIFQQKLTIREGDLEGKDCVVRFNWGQALGTIMLYNPKNKTCFVKFYAEDYSDAVIPISQITNVFVKKTI